MSKFSTCLTIFAFSILGFSANAQNIISGKVLEKETGESLPFATVMVVGSAKGAVTNTDGFFTILNIEKLPVSLEISYIGFATTRIEVSLESQAEFVVVELEALSEQLEEVVISASEYKILDASSGISKPSSAGSPSGSSETSSGPAREASATAWSTRARCWVVNTLEARCMVSKLVTRNR